MKNREVIGVFDSGVGGISVLRELIKVMPNENYLYFGDSEHAPYGTKTLEEVRALTIENVQALLGKGAKSIVVACNTATSAAVAVLRKMYPDLPLVGIEPAIKPAVLACPGQRVVVMATPMTLCQEKFQKLMQKYEENAQIIPLPCPGPAKAAKARACPAYAIPCQSMARLPLSSGRPVALPLLSGLA